MCGFAFDDGAYILGALCPAERADFERHLPTCSSCRQSVATLAVLPGLLGRLDAKTLPELPAPATLLPRVLAAAAQRRRSEQLAQRARRRWYLAGTGVAAAVLAAVTGLAVHLADAADLTPVTSPPTATRSPVQGPATVVLTAMLPASERVTVSGEVGLVGVSTGTVVSMRCRYPAENPGTWTVRLVVYPRSGGGGEQIGSWTAVAGEEVAVNAVTHLTPAEIDRVELHRTDSTALLVWRP